MFIDHEHKMEIPKTNFFRVCEILCKYNKNYYLNQVKVLVENDLYVFYFSHLPTDPRFIQIYDKIEQLSIMDFIKEEEFTL